MKDKEGNRINCFECVYFAVTWEPEFPKSCSLYGFKTTSLPSVTVYETTGEICLGFERKETRKMR